MTPEARGYQGRLPFSQSRFDPNLKRNLGILRKDIGLLSDESLRRCVYGMNNIEIPPEVVQYLNGTELVALCIGVFGEKKKDSPREGLFTDIVPGLVGSAFADRSVIAMHHQVRDDGRHVFPTTSKSIKPRMEEVSLEARAMFMNSYQNPYLPSNRETSQRPFFIDRNADSPKSSKSVYVTDVWKEVKRYSSLIHGE